MRGGRVTKIEGGDEARRLQESLERGDVNSFYIAEIGVGTNPNARITGNVLEDEAVFGAVTIGLGRNTHLGGKIESATHIDLIIANPVVSLDGKTVLAT